MHSAEPRVRTRQVVFAHFEGTAAHDGLWSHAHDHDNESEREPHTRLEDSVRSALDTVLTARQRSVVEMFFFEGASQGEIARRMGVTQQVVHKCLYGDTREGRVVGGALSKLRRALEPVVLSSKKHRAR